MESSKSKVQNSSRKAGPNSASSATLRETSRSRTAAWPPDYGGTFSQRARAEAPRAQSNFKTTINHKTVISTQLSPPGRRGIVGQLVLGEREIVDRHDKQLQLLGEPMAKPDLLKNRARCAGRLFPGNRVFSITPCPAPVNLHSLRSLRFDRRGHSVLSVQLTDLREGRSGTQR